MELCFGADKNEERCFVKTFKPAAFGTMILRHL
jgi:hypothetical protein